MRSEFEHGYAPRMSEDVVQRAKTLRKSGYSWQSISQILKWPVSTIQDRVGMRPRGRPQDFWSEWRIAELKRLWNDGYSAADISRFWEGEASRSAIIGKIWRLGMSDKDRAVQGYKEVSRMRRKKAEAKRKKVIRQNQAKGIVDRRSYEAILAEMDDVPIEKRVSLPDLADTACHWPCGDPQKDDFGYCGGASVPGAKYCSHHLQKMTREG
jgi:GcrA cell cycle regulator